MVAKQASTASHTTKIISPWMENRVRMKKNPDEKHIVDKNRPWMKNRL